MSRGFIVTKIGCQICSEMLPWIMFYNSTADVGKEVRILESNFFDSEVANLIEIVKEHSPQTTSLPTPFGMLDGVFINLIRTGEHFYSFLKKSID